VTGQVGSKRARRQAAKEHRRIAAEKRARARRRSQTMLAGLAGLAVVGIVVAVFFLVRGDGGTDSLDPGSASSAAATPDASAPAGNFPPLPEGADVALATRPVVQAGTGDITQLNVTTLIAGSGPAAENGQTLQVNYVGATYKDGKEFDNSWDGQKTYPVTLGSGGVIQGWDLGLLNAKAGSRVQLDVPANLGYGEKAPPGYPSGDLRFVVDVLSVE
jgi:peptidylprolyl isomerase